MAESIDIERFLEKSRSTPFIDVRSPSEFQRGHIPGALNLPLLSDEERMIVGKTYHMRGREEAVQEGLKVVGPKMQYFVETALNKAPDKQVLVYCWRGGMRSRSIGFLLETAGLKVFLLNGGYKSYRNHVLQHIADECQLLVLGGMTGSGKTEILRSLREKGEQVIDMEALANHKGSAFGHLGQEDQPSTEHFENLLFHDLQQTDPMAVCWIEDESITIGKVHVPRDFYRLMKRSRMVLLEVPRELRAERLVKEYPWDIPGLIRAVEGIRKRLGNDARTRIISLLEAGELLPAARELLAYYDKAYQYSLSQRDETSFVRVVSTTAEVEVNAELVRKSG